MNEKYRVNLVKKIGVLVAVISFSLFNFIRCEAASARVLDISRAEYGYGKYTITARGVDGSGVASEASVTYYYLPVIGEIINGDDDDDKNDGEFTLRLEYDDDDGSETGLDAVRKIEIIITDDEGNPIEGIPPIYVTSPQKEVDIDLSEYGLDDGNYRIVIVAYGDDESEPLYNPYVLRIEYKDSNVIVVPDTGNVTRTLNGMKKDYLITGLMVFAAVAFLGMFVVMKKDKKEVVCRTNRRTQSVASKKSTSRKRR